jgi:hypothetical protein
MLALNDAQLAAVMTAASGLFCAALGKGVRAGVQAEIMPRELGPTGRRSELLDADMTPADLADVLAGLCFDTPLLTLKLDQEARDYLVAAVRDRARIGTR